MGKATTTTGALEGSTESGADIAPEEMTLPDSATVETITGSVSQQAANVIFSRQFGVDPYEIIGESEEQFAQWKIQIQQVRTALLSGNKKTIKAAMTRGGKLRGDLKKIIQMLKEDALNEEDLTLLSIGLFLIREKSRWQGPGNAGFKLMEGGKYSLSGFLTKEGEAMCLDIGVFLKELAKRFGINGDVYTSDKYMLGHSIWKASDSERIVDVFYAWKRGGFFKDEESFHTYMENNNELPPSERLRQNYVLA